MTVDLAVVNRRFAAYKRSHAHTDAFPCCNAHASADDVPALLAEVERLRAQVAAARAYADQMGDYCSPHGVAVGYADELRAALNNAQQPTRNATTGQPTIEVTRSMAEAFTAYRDAFDRCSTREALIEIFTEAGYAVTDSVEAATPNNAKEAL